MVEMEVATEQKVRGPRACGEQGGLTPQSAQWHRPHLQLQHYGSANLTTNPLRAQRSHVAVISTSYRTRQSCHPGDETKKNPTSHDQSFSEFRGMACSPTLIPELGL